MIFVIKMIFVLHSELLQCRCVFCGDILSKWEEGHDPITQHRKWDPRCPFVLGESCGNIPLGEQTGHQNITEEEQEEEEDRVTEEQETVEKAASQETEENGDIIEEISRSVLTRAGEGEAVADQDQTEVNSDLEASSEL